jgi:tmRNA-binding protein
MNMQKRIRQGQFQVIDSFAIKRRNEFYLIGQIIEGTIQENWFINVPFNSSISMTVRISAIEDVEISSEQIKYKLIIVTGDNETLDFLLGLKIGSEYPDITIEGQD